jgi:murein DD-endopeptidase MepM/ murein hydrolase activator NlpD
MAGIGDIIGRVGNTGSLTEPHLHMHIDDQPSFPAGNGVPYEFASFGASGPVGIISKPNSQAITMGPIGPS